LLAARRRVRATGASGRPCRQRPGCRRPGHARPAGRRACTRGEDPRVGARARRRPRSPGRAGHPARPPAVSRLPHRDAASSAVEQNAMHPHLGIAVRHGEGGVAAFPELVVEEATPGPTGPPSGAAWAKPVAAGPMARFGAGDGKPMASAVMGARRKAGARPRRWWTLRARERVTRPFSRPIRPGWLRRGSASGAHLRRVNDARAWRGA
jgi:hypothetical protein